MEPFVCRSVLTLLPPHTPLLSYPWSSAPLRSEHLLVSHNAIPPTSPLSTLLRAIWASSINVKANCGISTSTVYQGMSWSSWAIVSSTCSSARTVQVSRFSSRPRPDSELISRLNSVSSFTSPSTHLSSPLLTLAASHVRAAELNSTLASLTDAETQDPSVSHALAVRLAVTQGNYTKLFRLFMAAPKMGAYIMDHFVERERIAALVTMTKA